MRGLKGMLLAGSAGLWAATAAPALAADGEAAPNEVEGLTVTGVQLGEPVATKTDTPLLETPQAVSVITAETLQAQGITRLADALRNVAGVTRSSTYGYYDSYQIRGYDAAYGSIFLDGLTSGNVAGAVNELGGLEQVEVIKGPASALFGASPLGGVVNLVSKRPKADRFLTVGLATGSYDLREVAVDANSPLTADGTLTGRLNVIYRDADDFVDFAHAQRIYIAPALTWKIAEDTRLTVLARHERNYDSPWSPVSAWGTLLPSVHGRLPESFPVNGAGDQRAVFNQKSRQIGYVFDHRFNDAVSFSQTVRYEDRKAFWERWIFAGAFVDDNVVGGVQQGHILGRLLYGPFYQRDKEIAADSRLTVKFDTGGIGHSALAGIDYRRNKNNGFGNGNYNPPDNPLDVLNPDYGLEYVPDPSGFYTGSGKSSQVGFYLHDHVTVGERVTLTFGGRWDTAKSGTQEDTKFSPHAGATFALTESASLYANYSKSFTPTPSWQTSASGELLPPETGENIEAGVKAQDARGRFSGMVSIYQLTRQNVATEDPANPFFYVVTGEQRSRGLEVEGAWRPSPAFEMTGAYAYIDAKITKDNVFPVGIPLANFPKHSLSLWGKYTVQEGALARLGISLGVVHNSDKHFYEGQVWTLPSYTLWDAGISYPIADWMFQLTVDNLTDERFFPDACCLERITPGEPRSWRLSARRTF